MIETLGAAQTVVEGEDDLILMGMVKDVTDGFTSRYMAGMLGVLQSINVDSDGDDVSSFVVYWHRQDTSGVKY